MCKLRLWYKRNRISQPDRTEGLTYWQKFKWKEEFKNDFLIKFTTMYFNFKRKISLHAVVQKYLSRQRGRFYCIFVDFRRAFDNINHEKLWDSLKRKGIKSESKFLKIFQSMCQQLKSCVKVNEGLTEFFGCNIGTRQGCISSPIIFLWVNVCR